MKKIFAIVAAALVAFSFSSCEKGASGSAFFKINITNIEATTADVEIVPADTTAYYGAAFYYAEDFAKYGADTLAADYTADLAALAQQYGVSALVQKGYIFQGELSSPVDGLSPNTEYAIIAFQLEVNGDEVTLGKEISYKTFKTLELTEDPVPADMTFEIAVSDITFNSAYVSVVPSSNEHTYFWNIFESEAIADMNDADLCAAIKANIENTIEYYGYFGYDYTFEDFLSKGSDAYDFSDLDPQKAYTVIAVAMGSLGTTNGAVAKYNFETTELVAESTEDITIENAKMTDACGAYGWWQMQAISADSTFYLTVSPEEAATVEGSYTIDDMDADYTYVLLDKEDQYKFATLDVEVAVDGENFTFTGTGIALNAVEYHFNISGIVEVKQASAAPAKVAPAKKDAKLIKKVNLEKGKFVSEKAYIR